MPLSAVLQPIDAIFIVPAALFGAWVYTHTKGPWAEGPFREDADPGLIFLATVVFVVAAILVAIVH